jgi:hypothetical protein
MAPAVARRAVSPQVANVRERLRQAVLRPAPLFPTRIPHKIACCQAKLDTTSRYFDYDVVFFKRHRGGALSPLVEFNRDEPSALARLIHQTRVSGHRVSWHHIRGRKAAFAKGDVVFFYAWHEQRRTYAVYSHYLGGVTRHDLREMVASARPLR